jgi:hypothetical protein
MLQCAYGIYKQHGSLDFNLNKKQSRYRKLHPASIFKTNTFGRDLEGYFNSVTITSQKGIGCCPSRWAAIAKSSARHAVKGNPPLPSAPNHVQQRLKNNPLMNTSLQFLRGLGGAWFWCRVPLVAWACASVSAGPSSAQDGLANVPSPGGA